MASPLNSVNNVSLFIINQRDIYSVRVHITERGHSVQQPLLQHRCIPQNVYNIVVRLIGIVGVLQLLGINAYAKRTVPFSIAVNRPTRTGIIKTHVIIII